MRKFLSLTMRFRPDITTWEQIHDRAVMQPGDVALAKGEAGPIVFALFPCCGDLLDFTGGQHQVGRDDLQRITIQPSIACRGCGAHYIVTSGAIVEGRWADPAKAAEWAERFPDPPRAGIS